MRVLHLIHTPRHSGAEMLVYELCRLHRAWGHECAAASFAPSQPEYLGVAAELGALGVTLFFPDRARVKLGRVLHYRKSIVNFKPDVIFAHSFLPSMYGRVSTFGCFDSRKKFISVLHSASNQFSQSEDRLEHIARSRIAHVIAVSREGGADYVQRFGEKAPVSVISNGIDIARFRDVDRQAARRELGLVDGARMVLQVGRICDVKQQQMSLAALRPLLAGGAVQLWFAGLTEDAAYESCLRQQVEDLGLASAVRILGGRSDIPELLAAADLYLMPSRQEAHSIALLEALASGVPSVVSDITAFAAASHFPGVRVCGVEDESAWRRASEEMLSSPRIARDLSLYSIERTAQAYLDVARGVRL